MKKILVVFFAFLVQTALGQLYAPGSVLSTSNASTNNVGIGIQSPYRLLHLNNNSGADIRLSSATAIWELQSDAFANGNFGIVNYAAGSADGTKSLVINGSTGSFGIGLTSPQAKLDVNGIFQAYTSGNAGTNGALKLRLVPGSSATIIEANNDGNWANHDIVLNGASTSGGNTNQLIVHRSGNVGIGSSNPGTKLEVNGIFQAYTSGNAGTNGALKLRLIPGASATIIEANNDGNWANHDIILNGASTTGGNTNQLVVHRSGNVGIGTSSLDAKLTVKGDIHTREVRVDVGAGGPDYVFEKDYNLLPLSEVESYIKQNKHLPEVPSAKEMEKDGLNLKEMNLLLLKKVEELTLHMIELKKENDTLKSRVNKLEN